MMTGAMMLAIAAARRCTHSRSWEDTAATTTWAAVARVAATSTNATAEAMGPLWPTAAAGHEGVGPMSAPCVARNPTTPWARTHPSTPAALAAAYAITGQAAAPTPRRAPGRPRRTGTFRIPLGYAEV